MNRLILFALAFVFLAAFSLVIVQPINAIPQAPPLQWSKTYYGDSGRAIQTTDGGYAIAANNASVLFYPAVQRAPMLIKTDSSGNLQWNKTFNAVGLVAVCSFIQTKDGGYALAGTNIAGSALNPLYSGWLIKTDAEGTIQWNQTVDSLQTCHVIQTSDGGYALTGYLHNSANGDDGVLVKMDGNGNIAWSKTFGGGSSSLFIMDMVEANDGGYVMVGNLNQDGWLAKTDANGNLQWSQTYHPDGYSTFPLNTVAQTSDGGYILAGGNLATGFLVKTDADGHSKWFKSYSQAAVITAVVQAPDGGFLGAGSLNRQAVLIKTDGSGSLLFNVSYGEVNGNVSSYASSVAITSGGGCVVAGTLNHDAPTTTEGYEITPSVGNHVWLAAFAPESNGVSAPSTPEFPSMIVIALAVVAVTATTILIHNKKAHNSSLTRNS
jgi:hypothetical protein